MEDLFCDAIRNRLVIEFMYEDHYRVVEPFTLGYHKDTGNLVLSAYRVGGFSKSHNLPPWRLFIVDKIEDLFITDRTASQFRTGYNSNDDRMSEILCTA